MRFVTVVCCLALVPGCVPTRAKPPAPAPAPVPRPSSGGIPSPDPADLTATLNAVREAYALPALREDPRLDEAAGDWASRMATTRVLDHGDFAGRLSRVYPDTAGAENIAEGYPTVDQVVAGWLSSPGHRANILGGFARVGVGRAVDSAGNVWWCTDFSGNPAAPKP